MTADRARLRAAILRTITDSPGCTAKLIQDAARHELRALPLKSGHRRTESDMRHVDGALQSLRRSKRIVYRAGGWYLMSGA